MVYIKLSTLEYPRYQGDIRLEHPDIGDVFVCPNTYSEVFEVPMPDIDFNNQTCYEMPPQKNDEKWTMVWGIRDLTEEEKNERDKNIRKPKNLLSKNIEAPGSAPDVI